MGSLIELTYDQVTTLTTLISAAQGVSFADATKLDVWFSLLEDIDFTIAHMALKKLLRTEEFNITPAHIRKACADIQEPQVNTLDAFSILKRAVSDYGMYNAIAAMEYIKSQDMAVHEIVKSIGFTTVCKSDINFFRPEFERLYREVAKEKKEAAMLPDKLKKEMVQLKDTMYKKSLLLMQGD
jgi:hypothetical protein